MSLREELAAFAATMPARRPPEQLAIMEQTTRELIASGIGERALKEGDHAPDFALPDATGRIHALREVLERGPVILTFYRGGWCPYCNLELRAYQRLLPEISGLGANLLAVSPQTPDRSLSTAQKRTGISGAERCRPARRGALRHRIRRGCRIGRILCGVRPRSRFQYTSNQIMLVDHSMRTSQLIGSQVYNDQGQSIGFVMDVLVKSGASDPTVVLSVGDYVGAGAEIVAVPLSHINLDGAKPTMAGATKQMLASMPTYLFPPNMNGNG